MSRRKNEDQENNLTSRFMIRISSKDMRSLKYLAEKECLSVTALTRKIILMYIKKESINNEQTIERN